MTHQSDSTVFERVVELLTEHGLEEIAGAVTVLMNWGMRIERGKYLRAAPYERTEGRQGYANGYKEKKLMTRFGELDLQIPQVRGVPEGCEGFYPRSLERGVRSERALKLAVAEMYVQGVSTRRVAEITQELCGHEVSSTSVSRAAQLLDAELEQWRARALGTCRYLILDVRYEKVRHGGSVVDCSVLMAVGVLPNGKRSVLGVSVSLSEAEVHWRDFLAGLQQRGLHGVELITSHDHAGLKAAIRARFPAVPWQRCQFHLQQNAQAYVPHVEERPAVAQDIRSIFDAPDRAEADRRLTVVCDRWKDRCPRLAEWLEENVPESLTVFRVPVAHRRRLRTSNVLERLSRELKRRTRVASIFPNEASLLRLVSAVLAEVTEEWETGKVYLNMETS